MATTPGAVLRRPSLHAVLAGLAWTLTACTGAAPRDTTHPAPPRWSFRAPVEPVDSSPPLILDVVPDTGVPGEYVDAACETVREMFGGICRRHAAIPIAAHTPVDARRQLASIREIVPADAAWQLAIVSTPLALRGEGAVMGASSIEDGAAVVSYEPRWVATREMWRHLVAHELGHALGLDHQRDVRCVMRPDHRVDSLIDAPTTWCLLEADAVRAATARRRRTGAATLVRVRGQLARRELAGALATVARANDRPMHPAVAAALAASLQSVDLHDWAWAVWRAVPEKLIDQPSLLVDLARSWATFADEEDIAQLVTLLDASLQRHPSHPQLRRVARRLRRASAGAP